MGSIGTNWLGSASRPVVASTAENASSSGTRAATRAPKASTSRTSVTGREVVSAFARSSLNTFSSALLALAMPNCSTRVPGWRLSTAATAARLASTFASAASSSPGISNSTSAEWRSAET